MDLDGLLPGDGFVRADRVVLDSVVLGSLDKGEGVVDLVEEQLARTSASRTPAFT